MRPLVVTYWTDDRYKAMADRMMASAQAIGLETKGYLYENLAGTWQAGDCAKPSMVLRAMVENPGRDVLFVDADCRFISYPLLVDGDSHDSNMACYFETPDLPTSTVLWLRADTAGLRYAARWAHEQRLTPNTPNDMFALRRTIEAVRPKSVLHLPPAYCWTEQWLRGRFGSVRPVIEHFAVGEHKFPAHTWDKSKHTIFKDGE